MGTANINNVSIQKVENGFLVHVNFEQDYADEFNGYKAPKVYAFSTKSAALAFISEGIFNDVE